MLNRKTPWYKSSIEDCDVHDRNALIRYATTSDAVRHRRVQGQFGDARS
jgi:hypothetical protein